MIELFDTLAAQAPLETGIYALSAAVFNIR
jgi:hypothetical protein